jgi:hypothetical protein
MKKETAGEDADGDREVTCNGESTMTQAPMIGI